MTDRELRALHLGPDDGWEEVDRFLSGSGDVVILKTTDKNGESWTKSVWDFNQDFEEIISIEKD